MDKLWKVGLALTGIFLAGAVAGGFVTLRYAQSALKTRVRQQTVPEQQWVLNQTRRFVNELQLDEAQREQVKPMLNRAGDEIRRLRKRTYRETMDIVEKMNNDIVPLLTPEQKEKFEDIRWVQRKRIEELMMGPTKKGAPGAGPTKGKAAPAHPAPASVEKTPAPDEPAVAPKK